MRRQDTDKPGQNAYLKSLALRGEFITTNFQVFVLTQPWIDPGLPAPKADALPPSFEAGFRSESMFLRNK
jgi:hypothetical protein